MLRSIDAEESAQQCRADQKTFDAANSAYNRGEFANASRLLAGIDARRLDAAAGARLRELMQNPGMQPAAGGVQLASVGGQASAPRRPRPLARPTSVHGPDAPGTAHAADDAGANLLKSTEAMRQVKFQELRADGLDVQRDAQAKASVGQTDAAIDVLKGYLATLDEQQLDPAQMSLLRRPVESRLQKFKILKIQEDMAAADSGSKDTAAKHAADKLTRRAQQGRESGRVDETVQHLHQGGQVSGSASAPRSRPTNSTRTTRPPRPAWPSPRWRTALPTARSAAPTGTGPRIGCWTTPRTKGRRSTASIRCTSIRRWPS